MVPFEIGVSQAGLTGYDPAKMERSVMRISPILLLAILPAASGCLTKPSLPEPWYSSDKTPVNYNPPANSGSVSSRAPAQLPAKSVGAVE